MASPFNPGSEKDAARRAPNMAATDMAGGDEHAHPAPPVVSVSTMDRAVMSWPVVGADPPVGLNEATPSTPGSGVDGRTVGQPAAILT